MKNVINLSKLKNVDNLKDLKYLKNLNIHSGCLSTAYKLLLMYYREKVCH